MAANLIGISNSYQTGDFVGALFQRHVVAVLDRLLINWLLAQVFQW